MGKQGEVRGEPVSVNCRILDRKSIRQLTLTGSPFGILCSPPSYPLRVGTILNNTPIHRATAQSTRAPTLPITKIVNALLR